MSHSIRHKGIINYISRVSGRKVVLDTSYSIKKPVLIKTTNPIVRTVSVGLFKHSETDDLYLLKRIGFGFKYYELRNDVPYLDKGYTVYVDTTRICNADIEGSLEEWKEIAEAILSNKDRKTFKRVGYYCDNKGYYFFSPRNSFDNKEGYGFVTNEVAFDLARKILELQ